MNACGNVKKRNEVTRMINSIEIEGYRGFDRFEMGDLGMINLLVGRNNSGKTSVLEAIYLLTSKGDPTAIWQLLWRRGEQLPEERSRSEAGPELDICHLFYGHDLHVGSKISFSSKNQSPKRALEFEIAEATAKDREKLMPPGFPLVMHIRGSHVQAPGLVPISRKGGMPSEAMQMPRRMRGRFSDDSERAQYITTDSMNAQDLIKMWDKIALTPNESLALSAMQFLDPSIERIASQSMPEYYNLSRGGFKVKQAGREQPVPIGSLGDGMWRMLAMAIAISYSKGAEAGVLLVDEIDSGLHYTAMEEMWRLLFNASKAFNVQIFATTHSSDCVNSLAKICTALPQEKNRVTLQRIESGKKKAIPYSEGEIKTAAENKIEVR
jgi:predicted ATPase